MIHGDQGQSPGPGLRLLRLSARIHKTGTKTGAASRDPGTSGHGEPERLTPPGPPTPGL